MDDLVQWLGEQLDDDESAALGAKGETAGRWTQDDGPPEDIVLCDESGRLTMGQARHIARHDPARVLREIDAKRRMVECHEPWTASNGDTICGRCGREHIDGRPGGHFPCQTLRLLALPYADRPGYREDWRP